MCVETGSGHRARPLAAGARDSTAGAGQPDLGQQHEGSEVDDVVRRSPAGMWPHPLKGTGPMRPSRRRVGNRDRLRRWQTLAITALEGVGFNRRLVMVVMAAAMRSLVGLRWLHLVVRCGSIITRRECMSVMSVMGVPMRVPVAMGCRPVAVPDKHRPRSGRRTQHGSGDHRQQSHRHHVHEPGTHGAQCRRRLQASQRSGLWSPRSSPGPCRHDPQTARLSLGKPRNNPPRSGPAGSGGASRSGPTESPRAHAARL